jgi:hypothetical protein
MTIEDGLVSIKLTFQRTSPTPIPAHEVQTGLAALFDMVFELTNGPDDSDRFGKHAINVNDDGEIVTLFVTESGGQFELVESELEADDDELI